MGIEELKNLVKKIGAALIMDGDRPSFVILSYQNYKALVGEDGSPAIDGSADEEAVKRLNEEVALLREEIRRRELEEVGSSDSPLGEEPQERDEPMAG